MGDEQDSSSNPLTATLIQEFQSLKDKFKNEDDGPERGYLKFRRPTLSFINFPFHFIYSLVLGVGIVG